jgi:hypothetical protein
MRFGQKLPPAWADFFTGEEYEAFLQLIRDHFHTHEGGVTIQDGLVTIHEDGRQFGLLNLAQECHLSDRENWKQIVETHFEGAQKALVERQELDRKERDYAEIRDLLAVRLWPGDYLNSVDPASLIYRQDLEGTVSVLVFNLPSSIQSVTQQEASVWNRPVRDLFEMGLQNVRTGVVPNTEVGDSGENVQIQVLWGDSFYVATHVLLLKDHRQCVGTHGSLVAVPHRCMLLCYPIEDMNVLRAEDKLIRMADQMYQEGPGSISPYVYWYDGTRFTNLPYKKTGKELQIMPPERYVQLMNRLAESARS